MERYIPLYKIKESLASDFEDSMYNQGNTNPTKDDVKKWLKIKGIEDPEVENDIVSNLARIQSDMNEK